MVDLCLAVLKMFHGTRYPITKDTKLATLQDLPFDVRDYIASLIALQCILKKDIPDKFCDDTSSTVEDLSAELMKLEEQRDQLFVARSVYLFATTLGYKSELQVQKERWN